MCALFLLPKNRSHCIRVLQLLLSPFPFYPVAAVVICAFVRSICPSFFFVRFLYKLQQPIIKCETFQKRRNGNGRELYLISISIKIKCIDANWFPFVRVWKCEKENRFAKQNNKVSALSLNCQNRIQSEQFCLCVALQIAHATPTIIHCEINVRLYRAHTIGIRNMLTRND